MKYLFTILIGLISVNAIAEIHFDLFNKDRFIERSASTREEAYSRVSNLIQIYDEDFLEECTSEAEKNGWVCYLVGKTLQDECHWFSAEHEWTCKAGKLYSCKCSSN